MINANNIGTVVKFLEEEDEDKWKGKGDEYDAIKHESSGISRRSSNYQAPTVASLSTASIHSLGSSTVHSSAHGSRKTRKSSSSPTKLPRRRRQHRGDEKINASNFRPHDRLAGILRNRKFSIFGDIEPEIIQFTTAEEGKKDESKVGEDSRVEAK